MGAPSKGEIVVRTPTRTPPRQPQRTRLTRAERDRRDAAVIADRAAGFTWRQVAERSGLTARQCQNIWKRGREWTPLPWRQQYDLVADHLTYMDATLARLAQLAEETAQDSVALGAIKASMELRRRQLELLQAIGILPSNLKILRETEETMEFTQAVYDFLEGLGIFSGPEGAQREKELIDVLNTGPLVAHWYEPDPPPDPPPTYAESKGTSD